MDDPQTTEERNLQNLAAIFGDGHQITDDEGKLAEEESAPEQPAAPKEESSVEQAPTSEKTPEPDNREPQEAKSDDETELGVDDTGKRYVPESRLKRETRLRREAERALDAQRKQLEQGKQLLNSAKPDQPLPEPERTIDKADVLELKLTKPQFNPNAPEYSQELDELAFKIFKAEPGLSIMEAADKAEEYAKALAQRSVQAKTEARLVKTEQADRGITGRGGQRQETQPDVDAMSDQEIERYLKETGQW